MEPVRKSLVEPGNENRFIESVEDGVVRMICFRRVIAVIRDCVVRIRNVK